MLLYSYRTINIGLVCLMYLLLKAIYYLCLILVAIGDPFVLIVL